MVRRCGIGVYHQRELAIGHVIGNAADHAVEPFAHRHAHQHEVRGALLEAAQRKQLGHQFIEFPHVAAQGIDADGALIVGQR